MKFVKELICFIIFIFSIFLTINLLNRIFTPKWIYNTDNMHGYITRGYFGEEINSLDVVFMGNSDTFRGLSPMAMWHDYGFTSYNYVSSGQRMWTAYYMLEEALETQKPKLIVLNIDGIFSDSHSSIGNYRKVFDTMPMGKNKIKAIMDPSFDFSFGQKVSFVFPFVTYHSRYNELTRDDFKYAFSDFHNPYKGLEIVIDSKPFEEDYIIDGDDIYPLNKKVLKYLDKFVNKCKKEKINLEFIWIPSPDSWTIEKTNAVKEYANKNNIKYNDLNYVYKDIGIDFRTDTADGGDHMNVYGAEKVSKYLGKYIINKYSFKKHNKKVIDRWNKDYKEYRSIIKGLESSGNKNNY